MTIYLIVQGKNKQNESLNHNTKQKLIYYL